VSPNRHSRQLIIRRQMDDDRNVVLVFGILNFFKDNNIK
jgi:hypothetical protein